jgi:hypothetical protein
MTIGDIETTVPYSDANPEKEARKTLYEHFKETNWWARQSLFFPALVVGLWGVCFMAYSTGVDLETRDQVRGVISLFVLSLFLVCIGLCIVKYYAHDRPWRKFRAEWTIPKDSWTTDVGGILKIYD